MLEKTVVRAPFDGTVLKRYHKTGEAVSDKSDPIVSFGDESRLRVRTSSHTDAEWDFDLDTGAKKFTSQNVFFDAHQGKLFEGVSYARLNAPGRFFTENINTTTNQATGLTSSAVSNFEQMRLLLGYGQPNLPGLSLAGGSGNGPIAVPPPVTGCP